jgi:hypothetical protein
MKRSKASKKTGEMKKDSTKKSENFGITKKLRKAIPFRKLVLSAYSLENLQFFFLFRRKRLKKLGRNRRMERCVSQTSRACPYHQLNLILADSAVGAARADI